MALVLKNNAVSRLASSLSNVDTSFSVTTGQGLRFPVMTPGDWFPVTVVKATGEFEVMRCTGRSTDVLTVTRAQEGTLALSFSVGDRVELRITAGAFGEFLLGADVADFIRDDLFPAATPAAARAVLELASAALLTAQTSPTDAAANRALVTRAFGLGCTGANPVGVTLNSAFTTGFYNYAGADPNNPFPGVGGSVIVNTLGGNFVQQIAIAPSPSAAIPGIAVRHFDAGGTPQDWRVLWHTGNFDPNAYVLKGATLGPGQNLTQRSTNTPALAGATGAELPAVISNGANAFASAALAFVREGVFGVHFGLDTDNQLKMGGYSLGVAHHIWHDGNALSRLGALMNSGGVGQIGAYGLFCFGTGTVVGAGTLVAGSLLRWSDAAGSINGGSPSGTWKVCGAVLDGDFESPNSVTLCVRVS